MPDREVSPPICPECGTRAGGPAYPRRWRAWRTAGLLIVLFAWLGSLVFAAVRAPEPAEFSTPWIWRDDPDWEPWVCTIRIDNIWQDYLGTHPDASAPDWYLRNVYTNNWTDETPVPADAPLEFAPVGGTNEENLAPWAVASFTMRDVMDRSMTDERLLETARADVREKFGAASGRPFAGDLSLSVAWRVRLPAPVNIVRRQTPVAITPLSETPDSFTGTWYDWVWITSSRVKADWPGASHASGEAGETAVVWKRPAVDVEGGQIALRLASAGSPRRWWLAWISIRHTIVTLVLLAAGLVLAWAFCPPIWLRLRQRRRHRRSLCLRCGYPLA